MAPMSPRFPTMPTHTDQQVFQDSGLPGVKKFYSQSAKGGPGGDGQPWKGGRAEGWLVDPWHANYFQPRLFRGAK